VSGKQRKSGATRPRDPQPQGRQSPGPHSGSPPPGGAAPGGRLQESLHPRNRHRGGLDFPRLIAGSPRLAPFVVVNEWGNQSLDFADPAAVKALNTALLKEYYGVGFWDIPAGYLCPSIPGRADYIHTLADLLASSNGGAIPRGAAIRALDIGVGANCVYPLIGVNEYGWSFVGTDIDPAAIASAARIVQSNAGLPRLIELRLQASPARLLAGVLRPGESFDLSLCNPPFHDSPEAAAEGTRRKWKNLGKGARGTLNFGGQGAELWTKGGESLFVRRLIEESAREPLRCFWYSTLVSKRDNLPAIQSALKQARALETRTIELVQGQKKSRVVAWTFLDAAHREEWRARRW
jgi:23S rRNA (adenine1618-N6)-methyltransferase